MHRIAIAADIFSNPIRITQRHTKGFNAAYADGSANWVERDALTRDLPGVAVAGAAYRGLGVAACVRQAQEAAARFGARLAAR